jgi:DNA-binding transcriptional ArsR family regulator
MMSAGHSSALDRIDQLDLVFGALADRTRRAILARLANGEVSVAELTTGFTISQPAVSKHLRVLERAGLITRNQQGTMRLSRLRAEALREADDWLAPYRAAWDERFDQLDELLAEQRASDQPTPSQAQPRPSMSPDPPTTDPTPTEDRS